MAALIVLLATRQAALSTKPADVTVASEVVPGDANVNPVESAATVIIWESAAAAIAAAATTAIAGEAEAVAAAAAAAIAAAVAASAEALAAFVLMPFLVLVLLGSSVFAGKSTHGGDRATKQETKRAATGRLVAQPVDDHRQSIERFSIHGALLPKTCIRRGYARLATKPQWVSRPLAADFIHNYNAPAR